MNYLTALLAFSAVMIVLATLATVVVEAIHKLARKRAGDFEQMLTKLYTDAVEPRLQEGGIAVKSKAEEFARQITRNPAFDDGKSGLLMKIPGLKNLFNTAFEELTTRQFVEQFAQTEAGKQLQGQLQTSKQERVQKTVSALSYEFERYGEAATSYFKRRAATLSVLVAFVIALSLNVDAITLYATLAADRSLAEKVVTELDIAKLEQTYRESIEDAAEGADRQAIDEAYAAVEQRIRENSEKLQGLGLPVGHDYFPYCADLVSTGKAQPPKDSRCEALAVFKPGADCGFLCTWFGNAWTVLRRVVTQDGIGWLFSALLAGGLIGMGAPFWFKTYRFIGSFVPGLKIVDNTVARRSKAKDRPRPLSTAAATAGPPQTATPVVAPQSMQVEPTVTGLTEEDLLEAFVNSKR